MEKEKQELEAVIDWVQVTFKKLDPSMIIKDIFQFEPEFMTFEKRGRFRYAGKWSFGGIEILTPPEEYPDMGNHIYLTGSACRELEIYLRAQKRTWFDFFKICQEHGGSFTRLDIALDDRKTYFKIARLGKKVADLECVSKFKNWNFIDGGTISGEKAGCTLNLGSRESKCSMVFYEKNYEQSKKTGLPVEFYGDWNRYEVRLRKDVANTCVGKLVERRSICFIGLEIMNYYIRFVVPGEDTNKGRWRTWRAWETFMKDIGKLKLSMRPAPRTLEQKKQWIIDYVAPTLKMIQMADDTLGEEFLKGTIEEAILKSKHTKMVEDYLTGRKELEEETSKRKKALEEAVQLEKQGFCDAEDLEVPFREGGL